MRKSGSSEVCFLPAAVIFIYVLITNLHSLGVRIIAFFNLFSPLIIGVLFALILYKPMKGINGFFMMLKRKSKLKYHLPDRAIKMISLVLTFVFALLLLYFIANSVVPQIVVSFKSIFDSIDFYYPQRLNISKISDSIRLKSRRLSKKSIFRAFGRL